MDDSNSLPNVIKNHLQSRPISIICSGLIIVTSLLNLVVSQPVNTLSLIPVNTMIANKYVWNVVTCAFYEKYFIKIIIDLILVLGTIKPLEIHSKEQFGLFLLVSIVLTSFLTSAFYFIMFFASKIESPLIQPTYGFSGVYVTLLMFCRAQYNSECVHFSIPQITYQNIALVYISTQLLLYILGVKTVTEDLLFSIISILVSWIYLRFVYKFEENVFGNSSDEFAFVAMFPDAMRPITVPLTTAFYNMGVMTGTFPPLDPEEKRPQHHLRYHNSVPAIATSEIPKTSSGPTPSSPDPLQERRRAKAMKLLDAKMAALSKEGDGWEVTDAPDMMEVEKDAIDV